MSRWIYMTLYLAILAMWARRIYRKMFFIQTSDMPHIDAPGSETYAVGYMADDGEMMWWWIDNDRDDAIKRCNAVIRWVGVARGRMYVKGLADAGQVPVTGLRTTKRRLPGKAEDIINAGCSIR